MHGLIVQQIEKGCSSDIDKAIRYYTVLFALNNIDLSRKQIEVIAFTAVKGTITTLSARDEFILIFSSSQASLENIKCKLIKLGYLVKEEGKCRVHKGIRLNFQNEIKLSILLKTNIKEDERITSKQEHTHSTVER